MALYNRIKETIINDLDPDAIYFTQYDIELIKTFPIIGNPGSFINSEFISKLSDTFKNKIEYTELLIDNLSDKPLDYSKVEYIDIVSDEFTRYAKDSLSKEEHLKKWIKYKVLFELFTSSSDSIYSPNIDSVLKKEPSMRLKIAEEEKKKIKKILNHRNGYDQYINEAVLSAICKSYDPHTSYFSPYDKKVFENSLSKSEYSFGISMGMNKNGDIEITALKPGGAAWKSNKLNAGDIIIKLQWVGGKEIDLDCNDVSEIIDDIIASDRMRIEITVRKVNGIMKKVTLIREKQEVDDNSISSYILDGDKKVGYIYLPGFYTEFENTNALGCANDVAKEIVKLKQEYIDGLILDLRDNGGGSLYEAIGLAGIFINYGPVCMYTESNNKPILLKDFNRGAIYKGPLIILVNRFSASASEIFSSALQDYNRALIVGTNTFGKSTGQVILPIDTNSVNISNEYSDFVKMTVKKYYRITGDSYQLKGVMPNVSLPDFYKYSDSRESNYPNPIQQYSIDKDVKYIPMEEFPLAELKQKSNLRISSNNDFEKVSEINDTIIDYLERQKNVPLNIDSFNARMKRRSDLLKLLDEMGVNDYEIYTAKNIEFDKDIFNIDKDLNEFNEKILKSLQEDIYLEETYLIMKDLIESR